MPPENMYHDLASLPLAVIHTALFLGDSEPEPGLTDEKFSIF
jgi:hypothetical protein